MTCVHVMLLQDRIYIIANEGRPENLLEEDSVKENLLEMMHLWQHIESTEVTAFGFPIDFKDICYRPRADSPCKVSSLMLQ